MNTKHSFYLILNDSPFPGTCEILPFYTEQDAKIEKKKRNNVLLKSPAAKTQKNLELWVMLNAEQALTDYPDALQICNNMP
jgi:hypothetical protein